MIEHLATTTIPAGGEDNETNADELGKFALPESPQRVAHMWLSIVASFIVRPELRSRVGFPTMPARVLEFTANTPV